jgi:hypothetical protein
MYGDTEYLQNIGRAFHYKNNQGVADALADVLDTDGIIYKERDGLNIYTALNPTQIKSVNNQGTFDPTNPNIYKSVLGGLGLYELLKGKTQNEQ